MWCRDFESQIWYFCRIYLELKTCSYFVFHSRQLISDNLTFSVDLTLINYPLDLSLNDGEKSSKLLTSSQQSLLTSNFVSAITPYFTFTFTVETLPRAEALSLFTPASVFTLNSVLGVRREHPTGCGTQTLIKRGMLISS